MRIVLALLVVVACVPPQQQSGGYYANPPPPAEERDVEINGARLDARSAQTLARLESIGGVRLPDGRYWYDTVSGAFGEWGHPAAALIGAGHDLGPPLPANASSGTSGVYINGRRLQHAEVQVLSAMIRYPWQPGRYFVDAQGNAGLEGGPVLINLAAAAQAAYGGNKSSGNSDGVTSWTTGFGSSRAYFHSEGGCRTFFTEKGDSISSGC